MLGGHVFQHVLENNTKNQDHYTKYPQALFFVAKQGVRTDIRCKHWHSKQVDTRETSVLWCQTL